jgi:4-hydroxy-tetrahydrodipicolinate synthase
MSLGARGVISVWANIAPKTVHDMVLDWLEGRQEAALATQLNNLDLIAALFCEVNPIPVKAAMNLMGMEAGTLRLPLCDISEKNLAVLRASMERMGLLK